MTKTLLRVDEQLC